MTRSPSASSPQGTSVARDGRGRRGGRRRRARRRLGARALPPLGDDLRRPRWRTATTPLHGRARRSPTASGAARSTLAAEARDLDELAGGRFVLGLGNGTRRMMSDWHGADPDAPAVRMEELVPLHPPAVADARGAGRARGPLLPHALPADRRAVPPPAREIPIYTAGRQPAHDRDGRPGRRRAARPHPVHRSRYIEDVVLPAIEKGARARPAATRRTSRSRASSSRRSTRIAEQARREVAAQIAFYASRQDLRPAARARAASPPRARRSARRSRAATSTRWSRRCSDRMVDALAVAGTPDDVRAALRRYEGLLDHAILLRAELPADPGARAGEHARADRRDRPGTGTIARRRRPRGVIRWSDGDRERGPDRRAGGIPARAERRVPARGRRRDQLQRERLRQRLRPGAEGRRAGCASATASTRATPSSRSCAYLPDGRVACSSAARRSPPTTRFDAGGLTLRGARAGQARRR